MTIKIKILKKNLITKREMRKVLKKNKKNKSIKNNKNKNG